MSIQGDLDKVRDALIVLSGHLPLFTGDRHKTARAEKHLALRDEAFDALDRLADGLDSPHVVRRTLA
jgi:hypothetical protein